MKYLLFFILCLTNEIWAGQVCFTDAPIWTSEGGRLRVNGNEFNLKGTSWFGFETDTHAPHGLWSHSLDSILKVLVDNKFNALRLPFSVKLVLDNPSNPNVDCGSNPKLCNLNALDLMEQIIDECGRRGIMVMLDQHRIGGNSIEDLWYTGAYPEAKIFESWDILLSRFGGKWNVFALDLKNEPHGVATWGYGNLGTDWNLAAQRIIQYIANNQPSYKGLFFVEGVADNAKTTTPNNFAHFWGGNLEGVHEYPIDLNNDDLNRRVVYSPHVYGPDVYLQEYFKSSDFPRNMPEIWQTHFGFVQRKTGRAVVVGEWGGFYRSGTLDRVWQDAISDWLSEECKADNFYWCLNPNSGDTGGILLDDWISVNQDKLNLLQRTQPDPSKLVRLTDGYCLTLGSNQCSGIQPLSSTSSQTPTSRATRTPAPEASSPNTPSPNTPSPSTRIPIPGPPSSSSNTPSPSPPSPNTPSPSNPTAKPLSRRIETVDADSWGTPDKKYTRITLRFTPGEKICGSALITMTPTDVNVNEMWNLKEKSVGLLELPAWYQVPEGIEEYGQIGMVVVGDVLPSFSFVRNTRQC